MYISKHVKIKYESPMVLQLCLPNWSIPSGGRKVTHASWKTQEAQKVTRSTSPVEVI